MSMESFGGVSQSAPEGAKNEKSLENQVVNYRLESGADVEVRSKDFYPQDNEVQLDPNRAVIFLPGILMNPGDDIVKNLGQSFAEKSLGKTIVISTKLTKGNLSQEDAKKLDLIYEEAKGIKNYIQEKGLTEITLAGWSLGGDKAIDVAELLQDDQDLKIEGVILLSPAGLYDERKPGQLKNKVIKDSLGTPISLAAELAPGFGVDRTPSYRKKYVRTLLRGMSGAYGTASNLVKNFVASPNEYPGKLQRDFSEMEKKNPRIQEIKAPVVLIVGAKDGVVPLGEIIPFEEEAKIEEERISMQNQRLELEKSGGTWIGKKPFNTREKYLKQNLFKKSPFVRMITAEKMGKHGLPVYRAEDVVNASLGTLERYYREGAIVEENK